MIHSFIGTHPSFDESNFIAPSAQVIGNVSLGPESSVWFNATVRADVHWIRIGARTNIQDNWVVHVSGGTAPSLIGDGVTVGHSAVVHGCTIHDNVLVGIGAIILDGAVIGQDTIIGANALVTQGLTIAPRSLMLGSPARPVRELTDAEVDGVREHAENYVRYSALYRGQEQPSKNLFYAWPE
jgi:carbonic anhydrase/acetyltransferase-like protein (isoleucine patch superfamily)